MFSWSVIMENKTTPSNLVFRVFSALPVSGAFRGVLGCSGVPVFLVLVHAVLGRRMAR